MGLDSVELVMAFEEEFEIEITDDEAQLIITVGDARDCIVGKLQARAEDPEAVDPGKVWLRVKTIVAEHPGLKPEKVTPGAAFVDDLRVE